MKKFFAVLLVLVLCLTFVVTATAASAISVYLNGEKMSFDSPPVVQNDTTLVPMRAIFEALGATVDYDAASQTVSGTKNNKVVKLTLNSKTAYVDGVSTTLSVAAKTINGRTMVPLRFISESLDCSVVWNGTESSITITDDSGSNVSVSKTYKAGTYKVGSEIPAGEYLLTTNDTNFCYIEVSKDSSGTFESIITNANYYSRHYITVEDGQYFKFKGTATLASEAAPYQAKDGLYPSGMYLVGKDIPAGEYKINVSANSILGWGYYAVCKDSIGKLSSIITNDNIENSTYQTVSEGQYLILNQCYIQK